MDQNVLNLYSIQKNSTLNNIDLALTLIILTKKKNHGIKKLFVVSQKKKQKKMFSCHRFIYIFLYENTNYKSIRNV